MRSFLAIVLTVSLAAVALTGTPAQAAFFIVPVPVDTYYPPIATPYYNSTPYYYYTPPTTYYYTQTYSWYYLPATSAGQAGYVPDYNTSYGSYYVPAMPYNPVVNAGYVPYYRR